MTEASVSLPSTSRPGWSRLWRRELDHYPTVGPRLVSLTIVVLTTVLFYYQYYVFTSVSDGVLRDTGMSFLYFVGINVVSVVASAVTSLAAGVTDRYGRANLVTLGLLGCALVCMFGLTNAHTSMSVAVWYSVLGALEGVVLVATPALVRDFSPQLGRASAMGFWTMGPVVGSLIATAVVSNTADHLTAWQDQYLIAGIVGLGVFFIALFFLRELAPELRDQIVVSDRDRALVEARAKGIDPETALQKPLRQMLHLDIIGSAIAISLFLFIYFVAVSFFPLLFQTVFGYTEATANGLVTWMWAFQAGSLIVIGVLSDLARVRKPFMLVGGVGAVASTIWMIHLTGNANTGYYTFALCLSLLAVFLGMAFAPWMAGYTETVENRNPALTATGLSVWGFTIRIIAGVAILLGPVVVTTVNTLVTDGPSVQAAVNGTDPTLNATQNAAVKAVAADSTIVDKVQALAEKYKAELATAAKLKPATQTALSATPDDPKVQAQAVSEISGKPVAEVAKVIDLGTRYASEITTAGALDDATQIALITDPTNPTVQAKAVGQVVAKLKVTAAQATADLQELTQVPTADLLFLSTHAAPVQTAADQLTALGAVPAKDLDYLNKYGSPLQDKKVVAALTYLSEKGPKVQQAAKDSPGQWQRYFWIATGCEVLFIPLIFVMAGFWDPRKARKLGREHDGMVDAELAKLAAADSTAV
jgi:ACS family D-galactonate transporter-like MFS transporter